MATETRTVSPIDNPQTLHDEVVADATLTGKYQNLSVKGSGSNNVTFSFSSALTGPEDTALDDLVTAYTDSVTSFPSTSFPTGGLIDQVPIKLSGDDFDLDWGDVDHVNLSSIGTNTHAQIDTHVSSTSNPHTVTKAQVGLTNVTDDSQLTRSANDISTFTDKAVPVNADLLVIEDSAASGVKKKIQVGNLPGGGTALPEKHFFSDATSFSTSSSTFVDAAIDTTPTLTAGRYKLDVSFTWGIAATTSDAEMNILVDGSAVMFDFWDMESQDSLNQHPVSYTDEIDFTAGDATHIIRLQARSPGGSSVTIDDFRYFLVRVE